LLNTYIKINIYFKKAVTFTNQPAYNNKQQLHFMTINEYNNCVSQYADNVFRFIVKNISNVEDAKDIVQTSFEKVWLNVDKIEYATAKSYLFTTAYHTMIDSIRKNKRIITTEILAEQALGVTEQQQDAKRILNEALATLNERDRSLVMLKDYEGYSYAEIGQITNLNESQVKVYLHRARLQLRNYLVTVENVL
jgi:RNA polymerase sigma factor (sigma-70 family)